MTKKKKKILGILKNTYCRLKCSKIHGVGIFAIRDIPKNTKLFAGVANHQWQRFRPEELKSLPAAVRKIIDDFLGLEDDGSIFIPPVGVEGLDVSFFLNYSKKPNAGTKDGGLTFFALRRIKKGEELTADYRIYDARYRRI